MTPLASVVIPAHNAASFLRDALASAQAQSLRAIEILIVDDESTDGTWEIAAGVAAADPRILPVRRDRRGGVSAARNEGIARARGRWIAPLDADDLFLPRRVERLVALADAWGADLLADNLLERDHDTGEALGPAVPPGALPGKEGPPLSLAAMLALDMPDTPSPARLGYLKPVVRRDFLLRSGVRYAEGISAGEDFLFYFDCVARGARFRLTPEAHYVYRRRRGSASASAASAPHFSEANRRMLAIAARLGDAALLATLRRRQEMLDYSTFLHVLEKGQPLAALRHAHCGSPARLATHLRALRDVVLRRRPSGRGPDQPPRGGRSGIR